MPKQIISASEMERYGYCPLSWHLDLKGIDAEGSEVNTGVEKHKEMGDSLKNLLFEEEKTDILFEEPKHEYTKNLLSSILIPDPNKRIFKTINYMQDTLHKNLELQPHFTPWLKASIHWGAEVQKN